MTPVVHVRSAQGLYGAERSLLALAAATEAPFEPRVVSLVRPGREDALCAAARARVAAFSMDAMVEAYVRLWRASLPVRA